MPCATWNHCMSRTSHDLPMRTSGLPTKIQKTWQNNRCTTLPRTSRACAEFRHKCNYNRVLQTWNSTKWIGVRRDIAAYCLTHLLCDDLWKRLYDSQTDSQAYWTKMCLHKTSESDLPTGQSNCHNICTQEPILELWDVTTVEHGPAHFTSYKLLNPLTYAGD